MASTERQADHRGRWTQAISHLFLSVFVLLSARWLLFEPYVIPSSSMVPTLLVKDHIFVNKFTYGLRLPFTATWLVRWGQVKRGDVVVFRSPQEDGVYLIKRVVAIPGDRVEVDHRGRVRLNGEMAPWQSPSRLEAASRKWPAEALVDFEEGQLFDELLPPNLSHPILSQQSEPEDPSEAPEVVLSLVVPENHFLPLGDNRDRSSDGRVYGPVELNQILGRASWIWLSCQELGGSDAPLCGLDFLRGVRWWRFGMGVR